MRMSNNLLAMDPGEQVVAASELADALKQIREHQRMLGKKTMENENLREAMEYGRLKKWIARSNMAVRLARSQDWRDGRKVRTPRDSGLVEEIQRHIGQLPCYGYRRV
ncbi:hypothetical protein KEGY108214_09390 [Kerstersia gyiorum]